MRWRRPNAWATCQAARLRKQRIAPVRRVSTYRDVIRTPSIPHGTIHSKGWRSHSTFTAKPCVVTPRETCTPIEAILSPPTQIPVRPSRTSPRTPSSSRAAITARSRVRRYSITSPIPTIG